MGRWAQIYKGAQQYHCTSHSNDLNKTKSKESLISNERESGVPIVSFVALNLIPLHLDCIRRQSEKMDRNDAGHRTFTTPQSLTQTVISARSFGESCHERLLASPVLSHSGRKYKFFASEAVA